MTFKVVEKRGGNYYLYESEGYWDPEKKQSRHRRKYIGKCDEKGNLIQEKTSQRTISLCKSFGPYYLLLELAAQSGLYDRIMKAHDDIVEEILALAVVRVVRPSSLRNVNDIIEESSLPEMLSLDDEFTSQFLSRFLSDLGKDIRSKRKLFSSMIDNDDVLIYDITGFDSLSKVNEYIEYGKNFRKTDMMQMNFGLVHSLDSDLPVYYKIFPGSINDVSTLSNLIDEVKELGVRNSHLLIDRGFFSESNITSLADNDMGFTIPVPFTNKSALELIERCSDKIKEANRTHIFKGSVIATYESSIYVGKKKFRAIVYYDMEREKESIKALFSRLTDLELKLNGKDWDIDLINDLRKKKGIVSMLRFSNDDGKIRTKRNESAINEASKRYGRMILLTTSKETWDAVLSRYRHRNDAEEEFRMLKSSMEGGVKYLSSRESVEGMMYVEFIALILRTILLNRMREKDLLKDLWIPDIINEMNKLKIVNIGNVWKISELTKKQKDLLKKLEVEIPYDFISE